MSKQGKPVLTPKQKVRALYERIAGDKLNLADEIAEVWMEQGYQAEAAWAQALFKLKLVKNEAAA